MGTDPLKQLQTQRILVVDDDISILKLLKTLLLGAGHDVVTCDDGAEALHLLNTEPFDLVITDAIMPVISGYELIKSIRNESIHKEIPIMMLTRRKTRQDVKMAVSLGVNDYILKPIDEHLLLVKVNSWLKREAGKQHVLECALTPEQASGRIAFSCNLISISESFLTCTLSLPIPINQWCEMNAPIFEEIGVTPPLVRLISCIELHRPELTEVTFEAKFSFIGVPEADLRKIRNWLNREEIRRRK
jgi:DNA-binding response OmpR family regulator